MRWLVMGLAWLVGVQAIGTTPSGCERSSAGRIPRMVLTTRGKIVLGRPLSAVIGSPPLADSVVYLLEGAVPRAADAFIYLDRSKRVRSVTIGYKTDSADFTALAQSYRRLLGEVPTHRRRDGVSRAAAVCWYDQRTRFRITRFFTPDSSITLVSELAAVQTTR